MKRIFLAFGFALFGIIVPNVSALDGPSVQFLDSVVRLAPLD